MPSPFPGMDPFIEMQEWSDFHPRYITVLSELLTPKVRPRYVVRVERRVYLERPPEGRSAAIPDVAIAERSGSTASPAPGSPSTEGEPAVAVVECLLPEAEEHQEYYLLIRDRETLEIVTVIELLSPSNKRPDSEGRELYLQKRDEVLSSRTSLLELDLLRGGDRMPVTGRLPPSDYRALVHRGWQGRRATVYAWTLRQRMPQIPVPLKQGDGEATLDLQAAFDLTYDRAAYQDSLDYSQPLEPPPREEDKAWLQEILKGYRSSG